MSDEGAAEVDLAAGLGAGNALAPGVRLRIALDVLEALGEAQVAIAPRTSSSRLTLDRVRIDDEGLATIEGAGDTSGAIELVWEILAGQATHAPRPVFLDCVVDDLPDELVQLVDATCSGEGPRTAAELVVRVEYAARGVIDVHADVRCAVQGWPRAAPEATPEREPATSPPVAAPPAASPPAPTALAVGPRVLPAQKIAPRVASPTPSAAATPAVAAKTTPLARPPRDRAKPADEEREDRPRTKEAREAAVRAKLAALRASGVNLEFYEASDAPPPSHPPRERAAPIGTRAETPRRPTRAVAPQPPSPPDTPHAGLEAIHPRVGLGAILPHVGLRVDTPHSARAGTPIAEEPPRPVVIEVEAPRASPSSAPAPAFVADPRPPDRGADPRSLRSRTRRIPAVGFAAIAGAIVGVGGLVALAFSSRSAPPAPELARLPAVTAPAAPIATLAPSAAPAGPAETAASPTAEPPPAPEAAPAKPVAPPGAPVRAPDPRRPAPRYGFQPSKL